MFLVLDMPTDLVTSMPWLLLVMPGNGWNDSGYQPEARSIRNVPSEPTPTRSCQKRRSS
jgi:hypothetical protein